MLSATAAEHCSVGDVVTVPDPLGPDAPRVVGVLDAQHTFGHVDIGYLPLRTWQESAGVHPGDKVPPRVYTEVTAVAVSGEGWCRARSGRG